MTIGEIIGTILVVIFTTPLIIPVAIIVCIALYHSINCTSDDINRF
jgi:hypothetical protein